MLAGKTGPTIWLKVSYLKPTPVTEQQLRDLHIKVRPTDAVKVA